jgi:phosphate transport system ATP-binding protein
MESRVDSTVNKIEARKVQVYYGATHAIKDVDVDIADKW